MVDVRVDRPARVEVFVEPSWARYATVGRWATIHFLDGYTQRARVREVKRSAQRLPADRANPLIVRHHSIIAMLEPDKPLPERYRTMCGRYTSSSTCKSPSTGVPTMPSLSLSRAPLLLALAFPALSNAHPGGAGNRLPPAACKDAAIESKLKAREVALLGGKHADEHAESRQHRCRVLQGLENDLGGTWTVVAPHSIPAAYHSSALLLPNGTVMLSEDDRTKTAEAAASHRVQIYSPPYLFKGARPKMGAPSILARGQPFAITATPAATRTIVSAVLIAPGGVTHGNDMHQRFVKLPIVVDGSSVVATVPASTSLLPPGYYMLFIVDSEGVPSAAKFVHIA